jgi:hypothetical protein
MKQLFQISLLTILSFGAKAQDFLAISTGNYAGVTGVALQPASIADNRYKFDINLFSTSLGFKSNFIGFDRSFAVANKFNLGNISNFYDFRAKTLSRLPLAAGVNGYANITNTTQIPVSFMIATGKKSAIALNMRSRTAFAMNNIPNGAVDVFFNVSPTSTSSLGAPFVANGLAMNGVSWLDIGLTYARVLVDENQHFIKAGVTGKYIGGLSSFNFEADKLDINPAKPDSVIINSNSTYVKYSHSPTNFNVKPENFSPDASSFGFDAGIVYEFRGRISNFKLGKYSDAGELLTKVRKDKNKYTFRLGASIVDAGKMTFTSSSAARDFSINKSVNFPNFINNINSVGTFDSFVNAATTVKPGSSAATYSIAMPTAWNVQLDLHLIKGIYVNGMVNRAFTNLNSTTTYRTFTPEYIAITPRWESRYLGLYVPIVQNNTEKDWRIGTTLRLAGFFAGTNNLATLFKSKSINEADEVETIIETKPVVVDTKLTDAERAARLAEQTAKDATGTANELDAKLKASEAKLKAAELTIKEMEKASEMKAKEVKPTVAPATPITPTTENQPVKIIINNYNTPNAAPQSTEMDGSLNNDIEELKKKIELKEKLIEELKKADKSTGCVELKKKLLA